MQRWIKSIKTYVQQISRSDNSVSKFRIQQTERECRVLWNAFDPLGVVDGEFNDDEYKSYLPKTAQLVLNGAGEKQLISYVRRCVYRNMGLTYVCERELDEFCQKLTLLNKKMGNHL